ncbi:MAG TPA: hypothetical protein H9839_05200, partial [Candidatus Intestinimonas stercorigallinarum]|nr:hypothetical protein [Candidatus Intestinimonas stercorigallinarum]
MGEELRGFSKRKIRAAFYGTSHAPSRPTFLLVAPPAAKKDEDFMKTALHFPDDSRYFLQNT